jgi:four helix bundle protein
MEKKTNDLSERLFSFAVNIIRLVRKLPKGKEYDIINFQLLKSSTSCGANYEEAQGAVSRPDFANKIGISLKEICECNYWIRVIIDITPDNSEWLTMIDESKELMNIFGSIYSKTSKQRIEHE